MCPVYIYMYIVIILEYLIIIDDYIPTIVILSMLTENIIFVLSKNLWMVIVNIRTSYAHLFLRNCLKI